MTDTNGAAVPDGEGPPKPKRGKPRVLRSPRSEVILGECPRGAPRGAPRICDERCCAQFPSCRTGIWHRQWPLPTQPQRLIAALRNGEELPCPLPEEALPLPLLEVSDGEPSPVVSGNRRKRKVRVRHWWKGLWQFASVSSSSSRAALHADETCNAIADYEEARAPCLQQ